MNKNKIFFTILIIGCLLIVSSIMIGRESRPYDRHNEIIIPGHHLGRYEWDYYGVPFAWYRTHEYWPELTLSIEREIVWLGLLGNITVVLLISSMSLLKKVKKA